MKLSKAQNRLMKELKNAPENSPTEKNYWWQTRKESDGRIYLSKEWSGRAVIKTLECLKRFGLIEFEDHPKYSFGYIVTINQRG